MTTTTTEKSANLWLARFIGVGNVNLNNAKGKGNRAARRAGWRVTPTAGPEFIRETAALMASV